MSAARMGSKSKRHPVLRYGVAVLSVVLALGLLRLPETGRGFGSVLFFAVFVSAWFGGLRPGLVSTLLVVVLFIAGLFMQVRKGGVVPVQTVIAISLFATGGVLISALVGALRSARRRAEASSEEAQRHQEGIRQSEARLAGVLENTPAVVYLKDTAGRYLMVNRRFTTLFGVDAATVAGKTDFDFFPAATAEAFRSNDRQVIEAGKALEFEELLTQADGVQTYLSIKFPVLAADGSVSAVCGTSTDITDRKRLELERIELLERERAARTEAEAANHAKDQFLAVLSHELRTPLTPILASVTATLAEPGATPEIRSVLELTQWGIELESRLIDDLLDMTAILRGRLNLHREPTDAHTVIQRTLVICREQIEAGGVTLVLDLAAAEHHVLADAVRLEQVFWNLIKNAVKFSPQGGTLTIHTENVPDPDPDTAEPNLVVMVSDTGIGIEPEILPRVFEPFTQGEAGWVRRFGGLGLGLAISRSVVEAHGGRIEAASAGTDLGSTFTVTLATVAQPAPPPPPAVLPSGSSPVPARMLKILLVEDDAPTLRVMTRLLGKAPYVVKTANTFTSALETATSEDFDLIISDIGLPDGSGLELMRQIRDRYIARGIALSGYGMEEDVRKSREAGFLAHLTKPVDFQKLQVAIEQVTATLS